jgi:hypothetical protein
MTRARPILPLPLLSIVVLAFAACATEKKPLTGFDKPPPGILLDNESGGIVLIWPVFDLPQGVLQTFRPRLNGQDAVVPTTPDGFYNYVNWQMQGWTGGWDNWLGGLPPDTYEVELVDSSGQSWGKSAPVFVAGGANDPYTSSVQNPAVVFTHFDGQSGSWTIDPSTQDADMTTVEITVTNLVAENVVVERCTVTDTTRTSCTTVGTVAPQADLRTVETPVDSKTDHPALFIHLASDPSQSYQRDLVQGSSNFGSVCQVERILVHGARGVPLYGPAGRDSIAMSTCFGYSSGPQ